MLIFDGHFGCGYRVSFSAYERGSVWCKCLWLKSDVVDIMFVGKRREREKKKSINDLCIFCSSGDDDHLAPRPLLVFSSWGHTPSMLVLLSIWFIKILIFAYWLVRIQLHCTALHCIAMQCLQISGADWFCRFLAPVWWKRLDKQHLNYGNSIRY